MSGATTTKLEDGIETEMSGGCLCGAVTYRIAGLARQIVACHCRQCRKTSGHYVAATRIDNSALRIADRGTLRWYRSSGSAERGFCSTCGSNLFWRRLDGDRTSIFAGTIDETAGLKIVEHIFVEDKGGYYDISMGA